MEWSLTIIVLESKKNSETGIDSTNISSIFPLPTKENTSLFHLFNIIMVEMNFIYLIVNTISYPEIESTIISIYAYITYNTMKMGCLNGQSSLQIQIITLSSNKQK